MGSLRDAVDNQCTAWYQRSMRKNVGIIAALAGLLWVWGAVASAQISGRRAPVFDVASIRPTDPTRGQIALQMGHGSFVGSDTVLGLVIKAYDLNPETVNGGPEWARSDWYDIAAKNQGGGGEGEIRLMLRALLADRFQLRSHFESATRSGYILTLNRKRTLSAKASKAGTEPDGDGSIVRFSNGFTARGATMRSVCEFLSFGVLRQRNDRVGRQKRMKVPDFPLVSGSHQKFHRGHLRYHPWVRERIDVIDYLRPVPRDIDKHIAVEQVGHPITRSGERGRVSLAGRPGAGPRTRRCPPSRPGPSTSRRTRIPAPTEVAGPHAANRRERTLQRPCPP